MPFLPDEVLCSLYAQCSRFESLKEEMRIIAWKRKMVLQEREIEEHDWFLGLRVDHQIPLDEAAMDFVDRPIVLDGKVTNHADRFSDAYEQRFPIINDYCNKQCAYLYCKATVQRLNYVGCPLTNQEIHQLLRD